MKDTILHILSANGHKKLLSTICTKDSLMLKACNARNETPFHHAARFGHKRTISELIHCATSAFGKEGLIELLRLKNFFGETALHEAARHGHGDVVSTLMKEDVDLAGLVNNDSASPLYLATVRGSLGTVKEMVTMLKQQLTKEVLQLYPEQLGKGTDGTRKIIHFVVLTGNCDIAKLLLDNDRSLAYIKDSDGSFPVHIAVRMGHVKVFFLLLQRCLDSGQLLDGNGRNFLHIAIEIPTTDSRGPNKSSESVTTRAQLVGLGSVLIAIVSFAAAFTLPGGTNQDTGTPILGRKYLFKAFILADFSAFFLSFISTMMLIRSSIDENQGRMKKDVDKSLKIFRFATKCLVIALALCLYLVVAHVGHTATIIIVFSCILILSDQKISRYDKKARRDKPNVEELFLKKSLLRNQVEPKMKRLVTKISSYLSVNILFPLIFIFVFALI
ncbi:protein ACCELERATED CELL DEATH 6-like [Carex rostrata]